MPYAFTEHGVIMLASVLKSETAIVESVRITKVFVAMRKAIASVAPILSRRRRLENGCSVHSINHAKDVKPAVAAGGRRLV